MTNEDDSFRKKIMSEKIGNKFSQFHLKYMHNAFVFAILLT